ETTSWLAQLTLDRDPRQAAEYARQTVEAKGAHPEMRAPALMILANADFKDGDYAAAIGKLKELVRLRRQADDWRFLGDCYMLDGDLRAARDAFGKALEIRPFRAKNHAGMAEVYRRLGNAAGFSQHQAIAEWLQSARQE